MIAQDDFEILEQSIERDGLRPKQARGLFLEAVKNKRADHWRLCLASFHVVGLRDGSTERLAIEADSISVDSIEDYARTYRLYNGIRSYYEALRDEGITTDPKHEKVFEKGFTQVCDDLRELRRVLHYTKWLIVANATFTGIKEKSGRRFLSFPEALDALKSGADGNTETFAAYVAGAEFTREKANRKALRAIVGLLSFPRPKREKSALKKALAIVENELGVKDGKPKR